MAKSNDCCLNDGCFSLAAKGLTLCLGCWDDLCSSSSIGDVCQVSNCLNIPDEGETVCSACWTIHDNANLPGFPSELDDLSDWRDFELSPEGQAFADQADQAEVNKCSGDGESYDFGAEDFDLSVKTEGSLSGDEALCDGCGKEECFCAFIDLVESDWAEAVAEQEELTDCTQSCKEMGMMSEGCDFCQ